MAKKRVILDCDPGHDDMVAIMLACSDPSLDLIGISTVAGNQTGDKTFLNARRILTLIKRTDIPLARGADKPLFRDLTVAPQIHGTSGLDGAELPDPEIQPSEGYAVDMLEKLIGSSEQKVILIPTGPLTNIALLFLKNPGIKNNIERIVLMGGAARDSNISPVAEFNIYVDPEAADIVFTSGLPITMVGLDVTNKALMTFDQIQELGRLKGKITGVVAPLLDFFAKANEEIFGINGAPVHDALAVASVIDSSVIETRDLHVAVETQGKLTRGCTVVDFYGVNGNKPNVSVALEVNTPGFIDMLFHALKFLDHEVDI